MKWEGPLNIECRAQESKFYYNIAFIPLWTLECSVGSVWYNICSSAMAGLTHGAVALPVIMGQRSEATPYPTIHKGSHTIHNVYTSTMDCNAGGRVAKAWDWSSSLEWARAGACGAISGHGSSFWPPPPLHYWLRPIESVQFRFDNFAPHFEGKYHFHFLIHWVLPKSL